MLRFSTLSNLRRAKGVSVMETPPAVQLVSKKDSGLCLVARSPPVDWKLATEQCWERILAQGVDMSSITGLGMRLDLTLAVMLSTGFTASPTRTFPVSFSTRRSYCFR